MFHKNEKKIIFIVRFAPLFIILALSIIVTYFTELANYNHHNKEINRTKQFYLDFNNEELEEEIDRVYKYLHELEKNSIKDLKQSIKRKVYEAHSIATKIYNDNKNSKTNDEILELIKSSLGSIIFNKGRGYYFIDDINGVKLLQPLNKELEGKDLSKFTDAKGYNFVEKIIETIKNKSESFDTYYWFKEGDKTQTYKKISFYKYFEPYNIAIGTGEYQDIYVEEIKQKAINYIQNIKLNDDSYIFLLDYEGNVLSHKNVNNIGKNLIHLKDKDNFEFIKEIINIGKNKNEGYLSYYNTTLESLDYYKKTAFVKSFDNWQWIIGTGYNNKDLEMLIKKTEDDLVKASFENHKLILILSIIITITLLLISIFISNYLEKIFLDYKKKIYEEEKDFRNLFENIDVGLSICDNNGTFIKVNSKCSQILGFENKDFLINKKLDELLNKNVITKEKDILDNLLLNEVDKEVFERKLKRDDNKIIDVVITIKKFKSNELIYYFLLSIIDITDIKNKDKILFRQSKMASMGEMIANIAHQWRQPLNMISTISSGSKMKSLCGVELTKEELIEAFDSITNTTQYLSKTIDDFRNFFKPDSEKSLVNIDSTFSKALKLLSPSFKNKDILLEKDIESINIKIHENDFIQVLINILNNAKDALISREQLVEKFIFIHVKSSDNKISIKIKDNAGGIPANIIDKIFEPYFTTKHETIGTGIGLYMVREIVIKHLSGTIKVNNNEFIYKDKIYMGAEFEINLPIET